MAGGRAPPIPRWPHRPAIIVVQVIGIKQKRVRFPLALLNRLPYSLSGGDMVGMRVQLRMGCHHYFRTEVHQQRTQIGLQIYPSGLAIRIPR